MTSADCRLAIKTLVKDLTANVRSQFVDRRKLPYRLQSAFIHRGTASSGHYWIYIRDFKRDLWREYNDETVSAVTSASQIYDEDKNPGRPATPYFLVYVRDDVKDGFVDPVCRDVPAQSEAQNAMMNDVPDHFAESYSAPVQDGQGTMAVGGNWFEADYIKPHPW